MTNSDIRVWAKEPELLPCPFCGSAVRFRAALWPSDGCTDAIIHAGPSRCGMDAFDVGTADRSVIAAWNNRAGTAVTAEREACAKVCREAARRMALSRENGALGRKLLAEDLAAAIRARGEEISGDE